MYTPNSLKQYYYNATDIWIKNIYIYICIYIYILELSRVVTPLGSHVRIIVFPLWPRQWLQYYHPPCDPNFNVCIYIFLSVFLRNIIFFLLFFLLPSSSEPRWFLLMFEALRLISFSFFYKIHVYKQVLLIVSIQWSG